jgi:very-short-patch-repair endonuclease
MVGMRPKPATPDHLIARLASNQHGIVDLAELRHAGITPSAVKWRVAAGRLHRVHRGVYAVGHRALGNNGRWMAAVKACGEGAVLSHRSAAELWGLLSPIAGPVHVTVPGDGGRGRRKGIHLHRSRSLTEAVTTRRNRIPVTIPARTVADLRRAGDVQIARRAIRQAEFLGLPVAEAGIDPDGTRSELEAAFLSLCRRHRLPAPEVNVRVGPFLVDFLWADAGLVVEVDGYGPHRGRQAFEDDRARDVELRLLGYEVLRFTYRQVTGDPAVVAAAARALLGRGRGEKGGG